MCLMIPGSDLNLADEQSLSQADLGWLATSTIAHMLWPNKDESRRAFLTREGARQVYRELSGDAIARLDVEQKFDGELACISEVFVREFDRKELKLGREWFQRYGGYASTNNPEAAWVSGGRLGTTIEHARQSGLMCSGSDLI